MRKKTLVLMACVLLFSTIPVVSLAADSTSRDTFITFTIEATPTPPPEPTPTPPPEPTPTPTPPPEPPPVTQTASFEINIPSAVSLNEGNAIRITSNYMNLNTGQNVVVRVETQAFNGWFELLGQEFGSMIAYTLNRVSTTDNNVERIFPGDVVARFDNSGTNPIEHGSLYIVPFRPDVDNAQPGTYTGTLRFRIEVENN